MKRFPIFKPGRHTAASGATLDFGEDQLRAAVAAYDPKLHEAPIVVGHPKDNHPAFGWVGGLAFNEATGEVEVDPVQVDADFAELVQAGRFKKRSASWYLPDAPNNPKPGTLYLRHVGFLGAQPPAVKGLRDVSFADAEEGVVEFSGTERWAFGAIADAFRMLREWMIGKEGQEAADKVAPNYLIEQITRAANEPEPAAVAAYTEEDPMKIEELQARVAALETENATLKANQKPADFAERETALQAREAEVAQREAAAARSTVEQRVDAAVKAGRLLPAQKKHAVDFALGLAEGEATIDFGEGDAAKKVTQREAYLLQLENAPKVVDYSERSADRGAGSGEGAGDPTKVSERARQIVTKAEGEGRSVSFTEAVAQATEELSGAGA
jgi:hypothetical protein